MNHRNWYWYLVFSANVFLPWFLCLARLVRDRGLFRDPDPFGMALSLFVVSMLMVVVYIWASLREHRACSRLLRRRIRRHFLGFAVGISCTWALLFISFATICANLLKEHDEGMVSVTYAMAAVSAILGMVSNVYLNMFEFRIGFDVFRHRYSRTLMAEIVGSINARRRANRR